MGLGSKVEDVSSKLGLMLIWVSQTCLVTWRIVLSYVCSMSRHIDRILLLMFRLAAWDRD